MGSKTRGRRILFDKAALHAVWYIRKAMTSLWPSPASPLNGDCHGLDVSIQTESDKNKLSHGTVGMVDNLEINKMVHVNCWK